jgi:hypothetical protein
MIPFFCPGKRALRELQAPLAKNSLARPRVSAAAILALVFNALIAAAAVIATAVDATIVAQAVEGAQTVAAVGLPVNVSNAARELRDTIAGIKAAIPALLAGRS